MIDSSPLEGGAADDNFLRAPREDFLCASNGANAAADPHFLLRVAANQLDPAPVVSLSEGGVEINYMEDRIVPEAIEKAENVIHGEGAAAPSYQLYGLARLKIDAGNDHRIRLPAQANGNTTLGQEFFQCANRMGRRMKDGGGKRGIGASVSKDREKILERVGAARGDHGHGNG